MQDRPGGGHPAGLWYGAGYGYAVGQLLRFRPGRGEHGAAGSGAAYGEGRRQITDGDVRWVTQISNCQRHIQPKLPETPKAGVSVGLAVGNGGVGVAIEIECLVEPARSKGAGTLEVGGAVEYEELELQGRRLGRKGTARTSAENVLGAFQKTWDGTPMLTTYGSTYLADYPWTAPAQALPWRWR